jgi:hypothetical protein
MLASSLQAAKKTGAEFETVTLKMQPYLYQRYAE